MRSKKIQKHHCVIELFDLEPNILNKEDVLFKKLTQFSDKLKLTVINRFSHKFNPVGLTVVYVLVESHMAVHTWPENGYLHIDLFTCSLNINFSNIGKYIKDVFRTGNYKIKELKY